MNRPIAPGMPHDASSPSPSPSPLPLPSPFAARSLPCLVRLVVAVLICTTLGNLAIRLYGVVMLAPANESGTQAREWARWLWYSLRYDALLVSWVALLLLFPLFAIRSIASRGWAGRVGRMSFVAGLGLWYFVSNALAVTEHYYLRYFGAPFGTQLFSVLDDDLSIAIDAAWHYLPVGTAIAAVACVSALQLWGTLWGAYGYARPATWRDAMRLGGLATVLLCMTVGNFNDRLLDQEGISAARNATLDDVLVNTPMRLYIAADRYVAATTKGSDAMSNALRQHGFPDLASLGGALGIPNVTPSDVIDAAWRRTPVNDTLSSRPAHVVFGLMEGWGGYGLSLDRDALPLAGAMRQHLSRDFWFEHAVAARTATFPTLEHLLINSGSAELVLPGKGESIDFDAAAARPFQKAGYRTVFVYGGSRTWRNIGRVMRRQGFDTVISQADILARYPEADSGSYGVYDAYLWRYVHDLLSEADAKKQPLFVFALTMSNHWPFDVPVHAAGGPFDLSAGWRSPPADDAEMRERQRGVVAYRYAMDSLGGFLDRLNTSPMGSRTIFVATGDHRAPQWRNHDNAKLTPFAQYHVPIYLRVPPSYLPTSPARLSDYVGHRDIFPTLYTLALSDTPYVAFGEPLFGTVPPDRRYAVAGRYVFSSNGVTELSANAGGALTSQEKHARTWMALSDWYVHHQRHFAAAASKVDAAAQ